MHERIVQEAANKAATEVQAGDVVSTQSRKAYRGFARHGYDHQETSTPAKFTVETPQNGLSELLGEHATPAANAVAAVATISRSFADEAEAAAGSADIKKTQKTYTFDTPVHEYPETVNAIRSIWDKAAHGMSEGEVTFRIDSRTADSHPVIRPVEGSSNEKMARSLKIYPNTTAIVHTHPDSSVSKPSENDMEIANKHKIDVYVISRGGLYLYCPGDKKPRQIYTGTDWLNPMIK